MLVSVFSLLRWDKNFYLVLLHSTFKMRDCHELKYYLKQDKRLIFLLNFSYAA